jgi:hypothetical protein
VTHFTPSPETPAARLNRPIAPDPLRAAPSHMCLHLSGSNMLSRIGRPADFCPKWVSDVRRSY